MDKTEVLKLANLSRIKLADTEAEQLSHEFEAILSYVSEVKEISAKGTHTRSKEDYPLINVMREDSDGHESGLYSEQLLAEAPAREGQYFKVKKIL